ncbi:Alpha/Beta hydrolase protein [Xylariales sp. PMI_506]|nr:Alpha/Beta hydrolase protein [Xylariales sp. PMI_506]
MPIRILFRSVARTEPFLRHRVFTRTMATTTSPPLVAGSHFFEADGVRFHYLVRGTGPLLVQQSVGWGMSASMIWNSMGPHFEDRNTVLYFEPRGNGQSSRPENPETMTAKVMAEDLEHLRKHLGLEALPQLMGSSHAGAIALRYAELYPSRVKKLILSACQIMDGPPNDNTKNWIEKRKDDPAYAPAVAKLFELMGAGMPKTDEEFGAAMDVLLPWYFSDPNKADILRKDMAKSADVPSVYALQTNFNDAKPENKLPHVAEAGKVEAKTLILWGGEDSMCSLDAANAIAQGIKDSKLVIIPGVGHMAWIENPEAYWAAVHEFIDQ